jgi:alpha-tubulin suppressor-like RCC1 family protein
MPAPIDANSAGGALVRRYLTSADGVLVGWGHGKCGELGNSSTATVLTPRVIATPQRIIGVACGAQYSLWLTKSSQVYSCGAAEWGQLGLGDPSKLRDQSDGIPICPNAALLKGFKQSDSICGLTAGYAFSVALTENGEMYLWGNNNHGQCSVGSQLRSDNVRVCQPLKVGMRSTKVVDVACGSFFVVVLTATNTVLSWGLVSVLGLGPEEDVIRLVDPKWVMQSSSKEKRNVVLCPCKVSALDGKGIVQVVAGQWHVLAVGADGAVYSWGVGHQGRLGHGTPTQEFRPRRMDALREVNITQAACGSFHSCVLSDDGRVFVFGDNACGQCGLVGQPFYLGPTLVPLLSPGIAVMCGREHTTILLADGDVMVCGSTVANATGLGVASKVMSPVRILTNFLTLSISCGVNHGFALALPRSLELVPLGLLHSGPPSKITSMTLKDGLLTAALGASFSVVVNRNGEAFSFGNGDWGQLGIGNPASIPDRTPENVPIVTQPQRIPLLASARVSAVAAGYAFAVCITEEQKVMFWGNNNHSQGGLGVDFKSIVKVDEPKEIVALAEKNVVQIACGSFFVLALTQAMEVYSWGILDCCGVGKEPSADEVAPSSICTSMTSEARTVLAIPTKIPSLSGVITVAAGQWHAVVLTDKGHVYTWGVGHQGRLGHGDTVSRYVPTKINFAVSCSGIGCGSFNTWALSTSADLYMWGDNDSGQCGYDGSETLLFPTQVASNVRSVACGRQHSIIVTNDGKVKMTGALVHQEKPYRCKNFDQAPQPPPLTGVASSGKFALQVFSGPHHAFVLVEKDRPPASAVEAASRELRCQMKRDTLYSSTGRAAVPPPAPAQPPLEPLSSGSYR